ncbi:MAG TPA: ABC transporter permease [Thermoanaerobaculia bacterium]|jgi:ABC-2 type transport system permease protein|nr:ABC transporter permease [Thermoanaerobaculia bacterium]
MRTYLLETKYEFLKALRMPQYSLPTMLFPVVFYVFFGVIFGGAKSAKDVTVAQYMLATYGAFGVIGASLFGFGVSVAIERGQGWLEVKRTTPMPIAAYFVAKLAMAMAFSAIIVLLLFTVGTMFGDVTLTIVQGAVLFATLVAGSITFCALGLALGFLLGPNSAVPIVNLIYLPMSVLSGLWVPIWLMPKPLQELAYWLPAYHFSQLALHVTGGSRGESIAMHVLAMLGTAIVFAAIAYAGYRRDEGKLYG